MGVGGYALIMSLSGCPERWNLWRQQGAHASWCFPISRGLILKLITILWYVLSGQLNHGPLSYFSIFSKQL